MASVDPHRVILTGENPFIKISETDGGQLSTDASFWRVLFSPSGPGHVLYMKSELTDNKWRIYSDNIALARWLQTTIQGMLNVDTGNLDLNITDAEFSQSGDQRDFWMEQVLADDEEIVMTWYNCGDPLLIHTDPISDPKRPYGVCTVLIPAYDTRLTYNGIEAKGKSWPRDREGRPFSTSALAFSESWTEAR